MKKIGSDPMFFTNGAHLKGRFFFMIVDRGDFPIVFPWKWCKYWI